MTYAELLARLKAEYAEYAQAYDRPMDDPEVDYAGLYYRSVEFLTRFIEDFNDAVNADD